MSPVPIYTPGLSKVSCLAKQRDGRGLNPRPPDPEFEVLTALPHTPPGLFTPCRVAFRADTKSSKVFTPIRYVTLNLRDRLGAASLHNISRRNHLCVNRSTIWYGFLPAQRLSGIDALEWLPW